MSLPSPNRFKNSFFLLQEMQCKQHKTEHMCCCSNSKATTAYTVQNLVRSLFTRQTLPLTPMYSEKRLNKTAHLLYLDCSILPLPQICKLHLEILFDLSHPATPRDMCKHSCVRHRGKDPSNQLVATGISLLLEVQLYRQNCFPVL